MTATFKGSAVGTSTSAVASVAITPPANVTSKDRILLLVHVGTTSARPVSASGFAALPNCNAVVLSTFSAVTVMSGTGYATGGGDITVNISGGTAILGAVAVWYGSAGVDTNATPATNTSGSATLASPTTTTAAANETAVCMYTSVSGTTKSVNTVTGTSRYTGTLGGGTRFYATAVHDEVVASAGTAPSLSTTINSAPSASFSVLISVQDPARSLVLDDRRVRRNSLLGR